MKIRTHAGKFHADEVFSCAVLYIIYKDNLSIDRRNDDKENDKYDLIIDSGRIYDGGKHFDHHQSDFNLSRNGIEYASFGLIWKHFGKSAIYALTGKTGENVDYLFNYIDYKFIQPIDSEDTGRIAQIISERNNVDISSVEKIRAFSIDLFELISMLNDFDVANDKIQYDNFLFTMGLAAKIIKKKILGVYHSLSDKSIDNLLVGNTKQYIILDKSMPWIEKLNVVDPEFKIKAVLSPSSKFPTEYTIQFRSFENSQRCIMYPPIEWWGAGGDKLKEISGFNIKFVHKSGFLMSIINKEEAVKVIEFLLAK